MAIIIFLLVRMYLSSYKTTPHPVEKMACATKPNSLKVLEILYIYDGKTLTAADVARITGLEKRSVDAIFTAALQRLGLGIRIPVEIELPDGTRRAVKFLSLTPAGKKFAEENL